MAIRSPCAAMISSHHSGLLQRGGADVDPGAAGGQRPLQRLVVPDAAGQLDVQPEVRGDLGDDLGVVAPAERGVQVDQVDPLGTGVLPALRGCPRVAEPLLRPGPALDELDGLTAGDVDRGQQDESIEVVDDLEQGQAPDDLIGPQPVGRSFFGSLATISSYDVSTSSATSSSGIEPSRVKVFHPC